MISLGLNFDFFGGGKIKLSTAKCTDATKFSLVAAYPWPMVQ